MGITYPGQCLPPVVSSGTASVASGFLAYGELRSRAALERKASPLVSLLSITVTFPLIEISSLQGLRSPGPATKQTPIIFCYMPWISSDDPSWTGLNSASWMTLGHTFVSPW